MKKRFTFWFWLLVVLALVCNASGAYATTISSDKTYSEKTTIFPTGDVITLNPGVTLTINSEVTIMGNLINNGGTITVGDGGVLTVNGNVTNTSVISSPSDVTSYYYNNGYRTYTTNKEKDYKNYSAGSGYTRWKITTTTYGSNTKGAINVISGGKLNVNGNFDNNGADITVSSTIAEKISTVKVTGTFVNKSSIVIEKETKQAEKSYRNGYWQWTADAENSYNDNPIEYLVANVNLSNGYLCVDGNVELQDNSKVTFAGSGIGENVKSTIRVRNISGTEGNVTQSANAVISLVSGKKGKIIVEGTYTDNTVTNNYENHPWKFSNEGTITKQSKNFELYINKYRSAKLDAIKEATENNDGYLRKEYPKLWEDYKNSPSYTTMSFSEYCYNNLYYNIFGYYVPVRDIDSFATFENTVTSMREGYSDDVENLIVNYNNILQNGIEAQRIEEQSASVSTLLPIELTSFTATATESGYTFNWVTASEENNDYFTLEFSENGEDFYEIDYVHGAGTTSETSEYEYVWDAKPTADILYFRLKQTDYNGEFTYSDILVFAPKNSHGATRTLYYGPLKLNVVDGQLRYIENK